MMTGSESPRLGSNYMLGRRLGSGAMGVVYAARSLHPRRTVAVKVLHSHLANDDTVVARFLQERQVLANIDHPNVVSVHDLVAEAGRLGIVMDLVGGGDLRSFLVDKGENGRDWLSGDSPPPSAAVLDPVEAVALIDQVAAGLAAIHRAGIVHRDLKPANILLDTGDDGVLVPRITDFGVAKAVAGHAAPLTAPVGTPLFMAPEISSGPAAVNPKADIYSLGVMLFEVLVGRPPFLGTITSVLRAHLLDSVPVVENVPDELRRLLVDMVAKQPDHRPDVDEVVERLATVAPTLDPDRRPTVGAPRPVPVVAVDDTRSRVVRTVGGSLRLHVTQAVDGERDGQPSGDSPDPEPEPDVFGTEPAVGATRLSVLAVLALVAGLLGYGLYALTQVESPTAATEQVLALASEVVSNGGADTGSDEPELVAPGDLGYRRQHGRHGVGYEGRPDDDEGDRYRPPPNPPIRSQGDSPPDVIDLAVNNLVVTPGPKVATIRFTTTVCAVIRYHDVDNGVDRRSAGWPDANRSCATSHREVLDLKPGTDYALSIEAVDVDGRRLTHGPVRFSTVDAVDPPIPTTESTGPTIPDELETTTTTEPTEPGGPSSSSSTTEIEPPPEDPETTTTTTRPTSSTDPGDDPVAPTDEPAVP